MGGGLQEIAIGNIVPVTGAHRALVVGQMAEALANFPRYEVSGPSPD
jgi:hypothetical protein